MDLMDLFIKVDVEDKASDKLSTLANKTETLANKIGNGLETAAKIGTAAVGAASAAVTALVKASIDAYAEYEQLVGGVDTLFKDSSARLQEYAAQAYVTANVSANDYMSLATSFAASLLQGLAGDTQTAADMTNVAIMDMADNANKMGTDLSMIQNAYQGFAKQNYTMLDNLKLGYGGTKGEMQRLVLEASRLNEAIKSPFEEGSLELPNIILAIHTIQEELGITGTTALEASTTISGSVNTAKAAWKNLLVAIADENQDFGAKMDEFVETIVGTTNESGEAVGGVLNNILPRVEIALNGVGTLVTTTLPKIMEYIPGIITDFLPKIVTAGAGIVRSLGEGIYDNKDEILDLFFGMVDDALDILKNGDGITNFLSAGVGIIADIMEGITESIPDMVDAALGIVDGLVGFLSDTRNIDKILWGAISMVTELVNAITDPATLEILFTAAVSIVSSLMEFLLDPQNLGEIDTTVFALIEALATGIINAVFVLAEAAFELRGTLTEYIGDAEWWVGVGQEIAGSIGRGLMTSPLSAIFGGAGGSFGVGASAITDYFNDVANATSETDESGVADGLVPSLYGSDAIGTQKFGGGTVNNNSDTTNNTVGDVTMNIYAPEVSVEELEEIMARAVNGVLSR